MIFCFDADDFARALPWFEIFILYLYAHLKLECVGNFNF